MGHTSRVPGTQRGIEKIQSLHQSDVGCDSGFQMTTVATTPRLKMAIIGTMTTCYIFPFSNTWYTCHNLTVRYIVIY